MFVVDQRSCRNSGQSVLEGVVDSPIDQLRLMTALPPSPLLIISRLLHNGLKSACKPRR